MKSILIDTSSAILLFKSAWLDAILKHYHLRTGQAASRELTVSGYPGAARFQHLIDKGGIEVLPPIATWSGNKNNALPGMGPGERECIMHYLAGSGQFILLDDGRAAAYCRNNRIPYANSLLVPRILALADPGIGRQAVADAMAQIYSLGRYAPWIRDYAHNCRDTALASFLP